MIKKPKNKQISVAEKVAQTLLHPNQSDSDSESEDEATAARVIDYDEDDYELPAAGTTEIRKRNVKLLSEQSARYKGKIASRKDFEDDEEEEEDEDSSNEEEYKNSDTSGDEEALKAFSKALKTKKNNNEDDDSVSGENLDDDDQEVSNEEEDLGEEEQDEDDDDEEDSDDDDEEVDDNTEVMSKVNHEAEIQKGLCVQNQLRIWERLLELRINSQKLLTKNNQLPSPTDLKELEKENPKYKEIKQETCKNTCQLLQNLLLLQDSLTTQFSELSKAIKPSLKRPSPFRNHNAGEPPLKQVGSYLQERFQDFSSYRNTVLLKWDDRTKLLQPGAGTKKKSLNEEYDIIKKIDNGLMNKTVLIQKSQQLKGSQPQNQSKDAVKGLENDMEEHSLNRNIYDDSDFYHQQLRELIEYKANTSSNMSEVTKQFLELQKLRQKMKKKVDTRASKGRKLR